MESIVNALSAAGGWAESHPVLFAAVVWPFVLGVLNFFFKPRTPAEYAKIAQVAPRLAGFLQLLGALGIDPAKVANVFAEKVWKGGAYLPPPPPPPVGPSVVQPDGDHVKRVSGLQRIAPLRFMAAAIASLLLAACSLLTPDVVDALANKAKCSIKYQDLPIEVRMVKCGLTAAEAQRIEPEVEQARAIAAAARAEERARASAPVCSPDAGTPNDAGVGGR